MAYKIAYTDSVLKELKKLDKPSAKRIIDYFDEKVSILEDPRSLGKALKGPLRSYWRYRIGDYRVICDIQDDKLIVLVLKASHRKDVYKL